MKKSIKMGKTIRWKQSLKRKTKFAKIEIKEFLKISQNLLRIKKVISLKLHSKYEVSTFLQNQTILVRILIFFLCIDFTNQNLIFVSGRFIYIT